MRTGSNCTRSSRRWARRFSRFSRRLKRGCMLHRVEARKAWGRGPRSRRWRLLNNNHTIHTIHTRPSSRDSSSKDARHRRHSRGTGNNHNSNSQLSRCFSSKRRRRLQGNNRMGLGLLSSRVARLRIAEEFLSVGDGAGDFFVVWSRERRRDRERRKNKGVPPGAGRRYRAAEEEIQPSRQILNIRSRICKRHYQPSTTHTPLNVWTNERNDTYHTFSPIATQHKSLHI